MNKSFATKEELFRYLKDNKSLLITEKKSVMKKADAIDFCSVVESDIDKTFAVKSADSASVLDENTINVKVVINTTNLLDSHGDVHIKGLWNKTIKDKQKALHLKSHKMDFEFVISDSAIPSVKNMTWKSLGYSFEGSTQALIFDSTISRKRNEYMFDQYKSGFVTNHSVGMQYVALSLCVNSNDKYFRDEKDNWDKYYPIVANKEVADERGWFWAVTQARLIEGSAVVLGSNYATPTLEVTEGQPSDDDTVEDGCSSRDDRRKEESKEICNFISEQFKSLKNG